MSISKHKLTVPCDNDKTDALALKKPRYADVIQSLAFTFHQHLVMSRRAFAVRTTIARRAEVVLP